MQTFVEKSILPLSFLEVNHVYLD